MTTSKANRYWTVIIILLIAIISVGSVIIWSRCSGSQPTEISISNPPAQEQLGRICISGAVNNPGFYPLKAGDNINTLIQAAGGALASASLDGVKLYIPEVGKEETPQKINLNRAEVWLLEALPGIGESRANAIVAYRDQNGPFQNINELVKAEGIGTATYEQIKHLITVAD